MMKRSLISVLLLIFTLVTIGCGSSNDGNSNSSSSSSSSNSSNYGSNKKAFNKNPEAVVEAYIEIENDSYRQGTISKENLKKLDKIVLNSRMKNQLFDEAKDIYKQGLQYHEEIIYGETEMNGKTSATVNAKFIVKDKNGKIRDKRKISYDLYRTNDQENWGIQNIKDLGRSR